MNSQSDFGFYYPKCKHLIPYLQLANPNAAPNAEYCFSEYKRLTKYYSEFEFSFRHPECAHIIPSLRNKAVKESEIPSTKSTFSIPRTEKGQPNKQEKYAQKDAKKNKRE